jgi:hypothetical protein
MPAFGHQHLAPFAMRLIGSNVERAQKRHFSAVSVVWHAPCKAVRIAAGSSGSQPGRQTMTFNLSNLQQIAVSAVGALFAAALFISAAVGPAGQIV